MLLIELQLDTEHLTAWMREVVLFNIICALEVQGYFWVNTN